MRLTCNSYGSYLKYASFQKPYELYIAIFTIFFPHKLCCHTMKAITPRKYFLL